MRVHSLAFAETLNPIDQVAVGVPRSESLQIRHASLDRLELWHSALHEDQVDRSERRPLSSGYISSNLHFNLCDIKRFSWTHTLVLRFAFRLGKRYLFWTRQSRLSRADSHNPTLLRAAYHSWHRVRIPSRSLPASATWSRSPWCPPRGTIPLLNTCKLTL